jgi:hypothetical protein
MSLPSSPVAATMLPRPGSNVLEDEVKFGVSGTV